MTDTSEPTRVNQPQIPNVEAWNVLLIDTNSDLQRRREELLAGAATWPAIISDDDTAKKVSDFIKQMDAFTKMVERRRVDCKEPALALTRVIDGFFSPIKDAVQKGRTLLHGSLDTYLKKKAREEQARRDEAARTARAEEERKAREAREAIEKAAAAARASALVPEPRPVAGQPPASPSAAAPPVASPPAPSRMDVNEKIGAAAAASSAAASAEAAAAAKPSELVKTRGDLGAVASIRQDWTGELESRAEIDLEALRQHIPEDGLEKAIRAFVRAGGRELRGARIYQRETTQVR